MPIATTDPIYSINHLLYRQAELYPNDHVLGICDRDLKIRRYTYDEIHQASNALAHHYSKVITPRAIGDSQSKLVAAVLAPTGLDYVLTEHSLLRMGYCVMFISTNNVPEAVAHLLVAANASIMITHQSFKEVGEKSISLLPQTHSAIIVPQAEPSVYEVYEGKTAPEWKPRLDFKLEGDLPAFIVHSSGSTGYPKPIVIGHRASVANFSTHFNLIGLTTLPLYHNHGHSCLYRAFLSRKPLFLYPSSTTPLTTPNILTILRQPECNAQAFFAVPYAYKLLGESEEGVARLKQFELCLFGGSAMSEELGDRLVSEGVKLVGHYGLTETGQLMTSFRDFETDKDWIWMRINKLKDFVAFEERAKGEYEIICLDGWPMKVMSNRDNGSYATKDLFIKHPTNDNMVKFIGRLDDTLVLINGEKVNPVPMELTMRGESPYLSEVIVFGSGKSQIGALMVPSPLVPLTTDRETFLSMVQPAIDLANKSAPSHSQLFSDLIVVLPHGAKIPKADKGSILRPKVYKAYADTIENAYKALEGEDDSVVKQSIGNQEALEAAITKMVYQVTGQSEGLSKNTDLFGFGMDSLQAARIRNALLRDYDLKGAKLSTNFVFEHPSIENISSYLVALSSGSTESLKELTQVEQMSQLVVKYQSFAHVKFGKRRVTPSNEVVLLTGATGSLGINILSLLLADSKVRKVYCLVRAKNHEEAALRMSKIMAARGLVHAEKVVALASEFGDDRLGLSESVYSELTSEVTLVLHNAWNVNFNLNISSFESHIRGAVNLMTLALSAPTCADFYFSSSVSAVFGWPGPGPVPESVTEDPNIAQNMGYARSKWVTEKLCQIVSQTTPLRAVVLRIGQMVGSTVDGTWNETEAVSLMIKSANTIGALPNLDDTPSWLPVDYAARACLELAARSPDSVGKSECWHVVQPQSVTWSTVLDNLRVAGLEFDIVDKRDWVRKLRDSNPDPVANPTIKLLAFYEGKYDLPKSTGPSITRYPLDTTHSIEASPSLRVAPTAADPELVSKWIEAWRKTGFIAPRV